MSGLNPFASTDEEAQTFQVALDSLVFVSSLNAALNPPLVASYATFSGLGAANKVPTEQDVRRGLHAMLYALAVHISQYSGQNELDSAPDGLEREYAFLEAALRGDVDSAMRVVKATVRHTLAKESASVETALAAFFGQLVLIIATSRTM